MAANSVSVATFQALSASLINNTRKHGQLMPVGYSVWTVHSSWGKGFGTFSRHAFGGGDDVSSSWGPNRRRGGPWSCQGCWRVQADRVQDAAMPARFGGIPRVSGRRPALLPILTVRAAGDGEADTATIVESEFENRTEADQLVDGMTFAQLCDEFECTSSPAIEQTARLLARDLLEGNRVFGVYALFVKYKDPLRSFTGRAVYKRASWEDGALQETSVSIIRMEMRSTSVLKIEWILRGKPRIVPVGIDKIILKVTSTYTLNQISGQVVEHVEEWDLSQSSPQAQAYFWITRLAYATVQAGKDAGLLLEGLKKMIDRDDDSDTAVFYADPSGDPRKFFVEDNNFQSDFYQIGLVIALLYLAVQFLRLTL